MNIDNKNFKNKNDCLRVEDIKPGQVFRPCGEIDFYFKTGDGGVYNIETGEEDRYLDDDDPVEFVQGHYVVESISDTITE